MSNLAATSLLVQPVSPQRDHIQGSLDAPVMLVEYGDYECPYCGRAHTAVKQVQSAMKGQMAFVFRHFPLTTIHPNAEHAAEAAEAAGTQGKFWEMHDELFAHQDALGLPYLLAYAAQLGLDVAHLSRELDSRSHRARVREDFLSGVHSGVNGTPTFFINGVRHDGSYDGPTLLAAVRQAAASTRVRSR